MRGLPLVAAIMLAGCGERGSHWNSAAFEYTCDSPQMAKAQTEALWCKENTDYRAEYCYGSAIMRNCTVRTEKENAPDTATGGHGIVQAGTSLVPAP